MTVSDSDPRVPWSARLPVMDRRRWDRYREQLPAIEAARWVPIPRHEDAREFPPYRAPAARLAYEAALRLDADVPAETHKERRSILLRENW